MDFKKCLKAITDKFIENNIDFALIGAFALLQSGIERATRDIDFLILSEDLERVKQVMSNLTYEAVQTTKLFSQFESPLKVFGSVDFLHASGKEGKQILKDAEKCDFLGVKLKIVRPEDLIGLKVLAYSNDPSREERDKSDILLLNEAHRNAKIKLDLEKIKSYYEMFDKLDDYSKVWSKK
ncbi:MAG TPA: nucleotidyltransferase [Nitrospinota bacterium]|jgi:hypothetical protein|nr:nucleotidyltransferase [Nitrospinota bacterium]|tara:strand:- start:381 stop:923 length:543 start_codon:yes stop_codon:yes gene_type:complete